MKSNDFVVFALKSPLHVMMGDTLLVTVTGRKTGRKIDVPVNYYQDGNTLWVLSQRDRKWWRNLAGGAEVDLRLHGRQLHGAAETVLDEQEVAAQLGAYVRHIPVAARYLRVKMQDGAPDGEDLARLAKTRMFVRICVL